MDYDTAGCEQVRCDEATNEEEHIVELACQMTMTSVHSSVSSSANFVFMHTCSP